MIITFITFYFPCFKNPTFASLLFKALPKRCLFKNLLIAGENRNLPFTSKKFMHYFYVQNKWLTWDIFFHWNSNILVKHLTWKYFFYKKRDYCNFLIWKIITICMTESMYTETFVMPFALRWIRHISYTYSMKTF